MPCPAQIGKESASVVRVSGCRILLADERLLASAQTGIVSEMHVREGDSVRKGQLLADLDASIPKSSLAVVVKEAENDVDVRFARVAARVAEAEYALALEANKQQPETFSRIELEKLGLEKQRSVLSIEVSEHKMAINRLRRDEAKTLVSSYRILSPMDGIVSRVYKDPGEAVQAGESLLQCRNTKTLHVEADLNISLLGTVRRGSKVRIIPSTAHPAAARGSDGVDGYVFFVDVIADAVSQTVRILVELDNRDGLLLAGTEALLEISRRPPNSRAAAVQRD